VEVELTITPNHQDDDDPAMEGANENMNDDERHEAGAAEPETVSKSKKLHTATRSGSALKCNRCVKNDRKCLHNAKGLDPRRCSAFLQGTIPKGFSKPELAKIRAAAAELDNTSNESLEAEPSPRDSDGEMDVSENEDEASSDESDISSNPKTVPERPVASAEASKEKGLKRKRADTAPLSRTDPSNAILTPAQTPSVTGESIDTDMRRQTRQSSQKDKKIEAVVNELKKRGVIFEEDDEDEEMEDLSIDPEPSTPRQVSHLFLKQSSRDLYEIAPSLRPQPAVTRVPDPPNTRLSQKASSLEILQQRTRERRANFNDPHKIVLRQNMPSQIVRTTIEEESALTEAQIRAYDTPSIERKEVEKTFEEFLKMPEDPFVVRDKVTMGRKGVVKNFELAFRDRAKMNVNVNAAGKRARNTAANERWGFTGRRLAKDGWEDDFALLRMKDLDVNEAAEFW
jgi:hypothetical protein